jgi:hypothetical protein
VTCVLRVSAPALEEVLPRLGVQPYRFEDETAHFLVSESGFRELGAQMEDAIAFLKDHKADVEAMMSLPTVEAWLDFGVADRNRPAQSNRFTPELVCLAGKAGIGLEISTYSVESPDLSVQ